MSRVGLITYHAAYNYGSVLQAYATQKKIASLGNKVTVVDYRSEEGDRFYEALYRTHMGLRTWLADLTMLPVAKLRRNRNDKFKQFITENLPLSERCYKQPEELKELADAFDIAVSGSDQIINKHSNELENVGWEYMAPFLLEWSNAKKISYASSPATMTDDDLERIAPSLKQFDELSVREENANARIAKVTGKTVTTVCDPTLLLNQQEWLEDLGQHSLPEVLANDISASSGFVFFYSLLRPKRGAVVFKQLRTLAQRFGKPIAVLTPLAGNVPKCAELINVLDSGPSEFLALMEHADAVITDSYHGTLFSINFHKTFWVFTEHEIAKELTSRRGQILSKLGLQNRIIEDLPSLQSIDQIDYTAADKALAVFRKQSVDYLTGALENK